MTIIKTTGTKLSLHIYISLYNFDYIIKLDLRLTEMKQLLPLSANCLVQIIVD